MLVMAFGTFDFLHLGHVYYLTQARRLGDTLLVVVARDASVLKMKKRKPYFNENERLQLVASLKVVDQAVLGKKGGNMFSIVAERKPGVIVLGYDQRVDEESLRAYLNGRGLNPKIIRFKKSFKPSKHKSSLVRKGVGMRG